MNSRWYYALAIGIVVFDVLFFWGIMKAIFQADINTNLFNTGLTPGMVLGVANIILIWALYKRKV